MQSTIQHDRSAHRFHAEVDGARCLLDYTLASGVMSIVHTEVPPAVGGRGIASALTEAAITTARQEGWKVEPACSYAAAWMQRHPEQRDLLV